jgi:hypothetical protein
MLGAVLAIVFNILHPRSSDVGVAATAALARDEGIWELDHYILGWTVGLALLAFIVIAQSMSGEPSHSWASVALWFSIGSSALLFVAITIDGFAIAQAAETSPELAETMAHVGQGVFVAAVGSFFGLLPVLFGLAVLTGDDYPSWLGWLAVGSGLLGVVTSTMIFFDGVTETSGNVLFPITSVAFTVWIGSMSYLLWQKNGTTEAAA